MKNTLQNFNQIEDDCELLNLMVDDSKNYPGIYRPGPYWFNKTKSAVNELRKYGLKDFRGMVSGAGTSFADNAYVDKRGSYNFGVLSIFSNLFRHLYPFNRFFASQVNLTVSYFEEAKKFKHLYLKSNDRVKHLLLKYDLSFDTIKGGCLTYGNFDGKNISFYYLQLLDILDNIDKNSSLASKRTFFEIGGGFGGNAHLVIELFKIKKIIYLDIAPNLYVGTQYLKSFYGDAVIDYRRCKELDSIEFSDSDELQIFCITPPLIEKIVSKIDHFHNAQSFVEMPEGVIKNYASKVESLLAEDSSTISLVSYDCFDLSTTIHPENLPNFFKGSATVEIIPALDTLNSNYHFTIR